MVVTTCRWVVLLLRMRVYDPRPLGYSVSVSSYRLFGWIHVGAEFVASRIQFFPGGFPQFIEAVEGLNRREVVSVDFGDGAEEFGAVGAAEKV